MTVLAIFGLVACSGAENGSAYSKSVGRNDDSGAALRNTGADSGDVVCIASWGDYCSCEPRCWTQAELDALETACDMGCWADTGRHPADWQCEWRHGDCRVVRTKSSF